MPIEQLHDILLNTSRPVFLFGSVPPREGTPIEKARDSCAKFAKRSAVLATDGFIVYDIQDEGGRTTVERPFPFRKTVDPSLYASFFPEVSGKKCIVYKCVVDETAEEFDRWMDTAFNQYKHSTFTLVGAATAKEKKKADALSLSNASQKVRNIRGCYFGSVAIPERHTSKGNEHINMMHKMDNGSQWFITQGVYSAEPLIKLIHDYGDICKEKNVTPRKVILTFAPCGNRKTMTFIKWLGMAVPQAIEDRIFSSNDPVRESVVILGEILKEILLKTGGTGVPLGINVESVSIYRDEINAAHELFQSLQVNH
jgi:hypothetical protein